MKLRLQARYSLVVVGLLVAMVGLMGAAHLFEFRSMFTSASRATENTMAAALLQQVRKHGEGLGRFLAGTMADPIYRYDIDTVTDLAATAVHQEGVVYVAVLDESGHTLAVRPGHGAANVPQERKLVRKAIGTREVVSAVDDRVLNVVAPVLVGRRLIGYVKVGLSLGAMSANVNTIGRSIQVIIDRSEDRFFSLYIVIAAAVVGFGLVISLLMVRGVVRPIREITRYTRRIGGGRYDEPIPVNRSDELGDLARSLGEMAQDLKQVAQVSRLATLGEMAVGMAHELSQPLNTIRLAADNALAALESGKAGREFEMAKLGLISAQAGNLGDLIQRMCVVGRSEGPQGDIDPRESVKDAYSLLATRFEEEGILVTLDIPETCSLVLGRRNELAQVVINLMTNARDAIMESLFARPKRLRPAGGGIDVSMEERNGSVLIRVKDNGGGVPPDVIDRVFDPFFTTKEVTKGTGLGLSISYGIVSAMGGRLTVENFGGGAMFTIRLPRQDVPAEDGLEPSPA